MKKDYVLIVNQCDDEPEISFWNDSDDILDYIKDKKLHINDYAIVEGILVKSFDNKFNGLPKRSK